MRCRMATLRKHLRQRVVSRINFIEMKQLEKKLKDLQKSGYETITILQVLAWMAEIKRENRLKAFERKGGMV